MITFFDLIGDLEEARKTSLLTEIQKKHIEYITIERSNFELNHYCRIIFNKNCIDRASTNVIIIDAKLGAPAQILTEMYGLLSDSLKMKKL